MSEAKPRRTLRRLLIILAILVLLPVLGVAVAALTLDTEALKPRIIAAVEAATGRRLALRGPLSFTPALVPTIAIEDVALANSAGGSAPEMLTARRVELRLALLPLLSRAIDIRSLTIVEPRLLLETDAEGRPNWLFAAVRPAMPANGAPPNPIPAPPREPGGGLALGVQSLTLTDGTVTWRDGVSGTTRVLAIERLTTHATPQGMAHEARLTVDGKSLRLRGETGTMAAFLAPSAPWPIRLALETEGASLAIEGEASEPARLRGWRVRAEGALDGLERLAAFAPLPPILPRLNGIGIRIVAHEAAGVPVIETLRLDVGEVDLGTLRPGLMLRSLSLAANGIEAPIRLDAEASLDRMALALRGTVASLGAFLPGAVPAPLPMDVSLIVGDSRLRVFGRAGTLPGAEDFDLRFLLSIPDAPTLAGLAGLHAPLPGEISLAGRLRRPEPGSIAIEDLQGTSSAAGNVAGTLTLGLGARPSLTGSLTSERLDLTGLLPPPATPTAPAAATPPAPAVAPAPVPAQSRVIPEIPIDLAALRGADADVRLAIAMLQASAELPLRNVRARLVLREGRLALDPITATTPGGSISGSIAADANLAPPPLSLALRGDGINLAALRPILSERFGHGTADVDVALSGAGADTRALAASLDGHLGLALVDGRISQSLLAGIPPDLLRLLVPQGIPPEGLPLRCFALRTPISGGTLRVETFLAETGIGRIGATGAIHLGDERIDLRLLPDLRTGMINLRAPIPLAGTLAAPRLGRVDAAAAAAAGLNALLGTRRTPDRTAERAAETPGGGASGVPDCAAALASARGGRQGAAPVMPPPAAPPSSAPGEAPRTPNAADILRGLLGGGRR